MAEELKLLTDAELAELEALDRQAVGPPWASTQSWHIFGDNGRQMICQIDTGFVGSQGETLRKFIPLLRNVLLRLLAEVRAGRAIVAKMPTFADGTPAVIGDDAYVPGKEAVGRVEYTNSYDNIGRYVAGSDGLDAEQDWTVPLDKAYPTREAVEKAKEHR